MPRPELLQLLLGLLITLFAISGAFLSEKLLKQGLSFRRKCLIFVPLAVCVGIGALASELIAAPPVEMKTYLILGFGYAFAVPTTVILLRNKWNTDKPAANYRTQLLKSVQTEVEKRLTDTLHNQELIDVLIEEQHHRVGRPQRTAVNPDQVGWGLSTFLQVGRVLDIFRGKSSQLAPGKKIIDIFKQPDIAGKLLILGAPGFGKTTMLLELARDLIAEAEEDQPIPVLFELSAWKDDKQDIADWLVAELKYKYGVRINIGKQLLESHQLLPLLDGLDEVEATRQGHCIEKINQFLQAENRLPHLVVCSRLEEYNFCETQLEQLNGAVCLQPLTDAQIWDYLTDAKRPKLWQSIQGDPVLKNLAASPFLLTLMVVAYEETTIQQANSSVPEARHQFYLRYLFDAYIQKQLNYPIKSKVYAKKQPDAEQTKRWLKFLAKQMKRESKTEFLIEKMQPSWLSTSALRRTYRIGVGLMLGLIVGLMVGLMFRLGGGLMVGLIIGLLGGLLFGLNVVLNVELIKEIEEIKTIETLKWSWKLAKSLLMVGLIYGLMVGLIIGLLGGLLGGLLFGLLFGLFFGLLFGLLSEELTSLDIKTKTIPNQGIWKSAVMARNFGLSGGLLVVLMFWLSGELISELSGGLISGLMFWLVGGGIACIQHFTLRLILCHNGDIPWNYARFLNYATERRLLQRIGGRYRFIHDLLREHLANL